MRTPLAWYILLVSLCILAPYAFRIRPERRRDWIWITVTIAFLTWLLAGFASLRAA